MRTSLNLEATTAGREVMKNAVDDDGIILLGD